MLYRVSLNKNTQTTDDDAQRKGDEGSDIDTGPTRYVRGANAVGSRLFVFAFARVVIVVDACER
jgi:hypothetical protein